MKNIIYLIFTAVLLAACNGAAHPQPAEKQESSPKKIQRADSAPARGEEFRQISPSEINCNPVDLFGEQWMLITAGTRYSYNTMTASWGTLGVVWSKPVTTCYIHPTRHTHEFMEKRGYYTLCFFDRQYRDALTFIGTNSGRDIKDKNKAEHAGLTPAYTPNGSVYFKEAYLVLECRKLYTDDFHKDHFNARVVNRNERGDTVSIYTDRKEFHKAYVGEIINCWTR